MFTCHTLFKTLHSQKLICSIHSKINCNRHWRWFPLIHWFPENTSILKNVNIWNVGEFISSVWNRMFVLFEKPPENPIFSEKKSFQKHLWRSIGMLVCFYTCKKKIVHRRCMHFKSVCIENPRKTRCSPSSLNYMKLHWNHCIAYSVSPRRRWKVLEQDYLLQTRVTQTPSL